MKCARCGTVSPEGGGPYCSTCGAPRVATAMPMPAPMVTPRTSGMAIAGFVLSFFCSLLGLIFSIIGYSECKRSNGIVRGQGLALAGIILSSLFIAVTILAAVAIPAFVDYMDHKARSIDAQLELHRLQNRAKEYYITRGALPTVNQPLTPAVACCEQPGHRCQSKIEDWQTEAWMQLDFEVIGRTDFQYSFESTPDTFEATAVGDPGCDGHPVTYRLKGRVVRGNLQFESITER